MKLSALIMKLIGAIAVAIPLLYISINHMVEAKYREVTVRIDGLEALEEARIQGMKDGISGVNATCNNIEERLGRIESFLYSKLGA